MNAVMIITTRRGRSYENNFAKFFGLWIYGYLGRGVTITHLQAVSRITPSLDDQVLFLQQLVIVHVHVDRIG